MQSSPKRSTGTAAPAASTLSSTSSHPCPWPPDKYTCNTVLKGLCIAKQWEKAQELKAALPRPPTLQVGGSRAPAREGRRDKGWAGAEEGGDRGGCLQYLLHLCPHHGRRQAADDHGGQAAAMSK
uniref:Uncharacterized protein n=1 Tax=Oryza sativa subsp. japonica TaxID=39947 RepID=Q8H3B3_ORYSJ|nr:hypothetical protein [Oryza sativa Japonica Group]BAD31418.1 hypothetical protein [Oryza sativa Japonica Group]